MHKFWLLSFDGWVRCPRKWSDKININPIAWSLKCQWRRWKLHKNKNELFLLNTPPIWNFCLRQQKWLANELWWHVRTSAIKERRSTYLWKKKHFHLNLMFLAWFNFNHFDWTFFLYFDWEIIIPQIVRTGSGGRPRT